MEKLFVTFTLALALIGQNLQGAEKYKTLVVNATTTTATYTIPVGEMCHVMYVYQANSFNNSLVATISGTQFRLTCGNTDIGTGGFNWGRQDQGNLKQPRLLVIAGPATITLTRESGTDNFCTLRLIPTPNIGGVGQ